MLLWIATSKYPKAIFINLYLYKTNQSSMFFEETDKKIYGCNLLFQIFKVKIYIKIIIEYFSTTCAKLIEIFKFEIFFQSNNLVKSNGNFHSSSVIIFPKKTIKFLNWQLTMLCKLHYNVKLYTTKPMAW